MRNWEKKRSMNVLCVKAVGAVNALNSHSRT